MAVSCDRRSVCVPQRRNTISGGRTAVSARRLAASLWHLSASSNVYTNRAGLELRSSFPNPNFATEGATKWDYCNSKTWQDTIHFLSKFVNMDSFQDKLCLDECKYEQLESRTNRKHIVKKQNDEKTERTMMCSVVKNLKDGVETGSRSQNKMAMENCKLWHDVAKVKLSAREFMSKLKVEKKARKFTEDLCHKLAKDIKGYKAEIRALRSERDKIEEEAEHERKMMQLAEVWREEHAQMKLQDAKCILENKFGQMNSLIAEVNSLFRTPNSRVGGTRSFLPVNPQSYKMIMMKGGNSCSEKSVILNECTCGTEMQTEIYSGRKLIGSLGDMNKTRKSNHKLDSFDSDNERITHHGSKKFESIGVSSVSLLNEKDLSCPRVQRDLPRNRGTPLKTISSDGNEKMSNGPVSSISTLDEGQIKLWKNPHIDRDMEGYIEWPREIQKRGAAEANLLEARNKMGTWKQDPR